MSNINEPMEITYYSKGTIYEEYMVPRAQSFYFETGNITEKKLYHVVKEKKISARTLSACEKKIMDRIRYLQSNLDEDQNKEVFDKSVATFMSINKQLVYDIPPDLSIDNEGYVIAEWRNYLSYDFILMMFRTDTQVSMTAIKEKAIIKKLCGIQKEIVNEFNKLEL